MFAYGIYNKKKGKKENFLVKGIFVRYEILTNIEFVVGVHR